MSLVSKLYISKSNYLNLLLGLLPVSFIAGNMIININIILIILSSLLFFGKNIFDLKIYFLDKLLIIFFLIILFTGFYNETIFYIEDLYPQFPDTILKSLFFLRYLMLYFIIRFLIEKKLIDLKFFFISSSIFSLFVCFDIFFQLKFGKDVFGFEIISPRKLSGPFGDELIAGGYILRFAIFSFFVLPVFYSNISSKLSKFLIPILFCIFLVGIVLSGNRMPVFLFVLLLSLILIFQKQTRKYFLPFVIFFTIMFSVILSVNPHVKLNFKSFYGSVSNISKNIINKEFSSETTPQYLKEFATFYDTWLMNKYIGGGIKNFRYYCHARPNVDKSSGFICNMHPHNYYLEILTETGLLGFIIISISFLNVLYISFYKKYFQNTSLNKNNMITPFIFLFLIEIFPLKSTGSFFTTGVSSYLFLILGILIGLSRVDNSIENKN